MKNGIQGITIRMMRHMENQKRRLVHMLGVLTLEFKEK